MSSVGRLSDRTRTSLRTRDVPAARAPDDSNLLSPPQAVNVDRSELVVYCFSNAGLPDPLPKSM